MSAQPGIAAVGQEVAEEVGEVLNALPFHQVHDSSPQSQSIERSNSLKMLNSFLPFTSQTPTFASLPASWPKVPRAAHG